MIDNLNNRYFDCPQGTRVLDVGAAEGRSAMALRSRGFQVTALEIDPTLVARFRANPESHGISIYEGSALDMPFADNSFERVLLLEVIEHIEETTMLLSEIHRVLKPGGVLCIGVPTGYTEIFYWKVHPRYAENATHVKIFSKRDLLDAVSGSGFIVELVEAQNLIPAISWLFHALLRSDSDHTGLILTHKWVDKVLDPFIRVWRNLPVLRATYRATAKHVGKSRYVYARKGS